MHVDAAVAGLICTLPWHRFETLLTAKIIEADPRAAEKCAKIWEAERFVRAGRTGQSGLKLLIAKANAGDVIWFMAALNRIAEILRLQGDLEPADVRRSKAIGILAQPALALQMLWEFRNEQRPAAEPQQAGEPIHYEPNPPFESSAAPPPAEPLKVAAANLPETLRMPASCFPYAAGSHRMDLEHTKAYLPPRRTARPNRSAQPRPDDPPRTSHQDPQSLAGATA